MPTISGIPGPYRFYFYSFDCGEPMHVHAQRDRKVCKFWLEAIALSTNAGFTPKELRQIRAMIDDNLQLMIEAWHEHCDE